MLSNQDINAIKSLGEVIDYLTEDSLPETWYQSTTGITYPLKWNLKYRSVTVFFPEPHYLTHHGTPITSIVIPLD